MLSVTYRIGGCLPQMMPPNTNTRPLRMANIVSMSRNNVITFFSVTREIVLYLCECVFRPSIWTSNRQGDSPAEKQGVCGGSVFWPGVWGATGQDQLLCGTGGTDIWHRLLGQGKRSCKCSFICNSSFIILFLWLLVNQILLWYSKDIFDAIRYLIQGE